MDLFTRLKEKLMEIYRDDEIRIEPNNGYNNFIVVNPFWDENIRVFVEDGITFLFSFQHAHFDYCDDMDDNIDGLIEYINSFIKGEQVAIEFFHGDTNLFGGARYQIDIDTSSGESLLKSFSGDHNELHETLYKEIKGLNCRCSIRGWNSIYNKDIDFVL